MVVTPSATSNKKKKKNATATTALLIWGSIFISILVCVWTNSISMKQISSFSSNNDRDEWFNLPPMVNREVGKEHMSSTRSLQLQLWYFPHMGHPWLEWMASQHNLTWGACYWQESPMYAPWCPLPQPPDFSKADATSHHHQQQHQQQSPPPLPPHSLVLAWSWKLRDTPPAEPSVRRVATPSSSSPKRVVVVLRNPYHRLIDLYYHLIDNYNFTKLTPSIDTADNNNNNNNDTTAIWRGPCRTVIRRMDEEYYTSSVQLNSFLIQWLKKLRSNPCLQQCIFLPQYEYIHTYHKRQNKTTRLVDDILHYEHLSEEWQQLAHRYPTAIPPTMMQLPDTSSCSGSSDNNNHRGTHPTFTEHDFSPTTLALIHYIYAMDFVLGNYTKIPIKPYVWPKPHYQDVAVVVNSNTSTINTTSTTTTTAVSPRLEMIHIPKTGGTMLELWVARSNVTWGACHFEFPWKWRKGSDLRFCPEAVVRDEHFYTDFPLWHAPRYMLPHHLPFDPYDNLQDDQLAQRPPRYFVVVRNPYERMISLFYMNFATFARKNITKCMDSPERFNIVLRQWFRLMLTGKTQTELFDSINPTVEPYDPDRVCHHACAFLPQAHYILPPDSLPPLSLQNRPADIEEIMKNSAILNRSSWSIQHMLHLEHLEEEMEALLKEHYPDYHQLLFESNQEEYPNGNRRTMKVVVNANRCNTTLTTEDLELETLRQIHSLYALDFVLGGYSMIATHHKATYTATTTTTDE